MYNTNQTEMWNYQNPKPQKEQLQPVNDSIKTTLILVGVGLTIAILIILYFTMRKEHGQILFSLEDIMAELPQVV